VNPGLAFGTGIHETTQLCLEALEEHVQPGQTLLDVGTGSGILALAGSLLGARPIYACDVDAVAVEVASCNAHVAPSPIRFFVGSVGAMASGSADLLAANISPEAIAALAPELLRVLRPDGRALVSGFERNEADQVKESMAAAGAVIEQARHKGSWALLSTRKLSLLE
jgi:ribosomal protein L11 methyltransferase